MDTEKETIEKNDSAEQNNETIVEKKKSSCLKKLFAMISMKQNNRLLELTLVKTRLLADIAEQRCRYAVYEYQKLEIDAKTKNIKDQ